MTPNYVDNLSAIMIKYNNLDDTELDKIYNEHNKYINVLRQDLERYINDVLTLEFVQSAELTDEEFLKLDSAQVDYRLSILSN